MSISNSDMRLYTHPACLEHDTGPGHPERADRLQALFEVFDEAPFADLPITEAEEAELAWIYRAHNSRYIESLSDAMPESGLVRIGADTVISPGSWEAALRAAGAVCRATEDVLTAECNRAFCAIRPPGHHAFPDHAEGFCLFNNIVIGALHANAQFGLSRIAILDFDVHHGNGSDAMARQHEQLFYASTHQSGIYPGTGDPADDIPGRVINRPLMAGDGSAAFRQAWEEILRSLDNFTPELIMISAGFDGHQDDPLAQINLTEDDFSWITAELIKVADRHCGGKVISVLEGGYNLDVLKSCTRAHLNALRS